MMKKINTEKGFLQAQGVFGRKYDWHCFSSYFSKESVVKNKESVVKKKMEVNKMSVSDIIFLIMSNTGMTQEQAAITVQNIITYMKEHTTEPLHKVVRALFGNGKNEEQQARLN
jgi:hypothetical protein